MSEQKPRTLFGKPLTKETICYYPDKISLERFGEILNGKDAFIRRMETGALYKKKHAEEWLETFAVWANIQPKEKIYIVWCHDAVGHDGRKYIQKIFKCEKSAESLCKCLNESEVDGYIYSVIEQELN